MSPEAYTKPADDGNVTVHCRKCDAVIIPKISEAKYMLAAGLVAQHYRDHHEVGPTN